MVYMESRDKEEILEAIGVFAEDVDRRFESVDRRFEMIDTRLDNGDRRFGSIEQRLDRIESTMATKDDISNIMDSLDWLVSHAKKHDQELVMMAHGFRRLSDDVDKIKPLVGLKS